VQEVGRPEQVRQGAVQGTQVVPEGTKPGLQLLQVVAEPEQVAQSVSQAPQLFASTS